MEHIKTRKSFRLIPSQYPPIQLFEDLLDADELDAAYAFEALTNDRLRDEVGDIQLVPQDERVVGPGSSAIMAAFTHIHVPSRYTDGSYGVYYAALDIDTALAESSASQIKRMTATNEGAQMIQMRCYVAGIDAHLVDLRGEDRYQDPDSWAACQEIGLRHRQASNDGILYSSVRHADGDCVAAFKTTAIIPPANQSAHFEFHWDGEKITHTSKIISTNQ